MSSLESDASVLAHSIVSVDTAPEPLSIPTDLYSWQALFQSRRDWALGLLEKGRALAAETHDNIEAVPTVQRGVDVALGNLQAHINSLQQRHQEAHAWVKQTAQEQESILSNLDNVGPQLQSLPALEGFDRFFPGLKDSSKDGQEARQTRNLVDLVDASSVDTAVQTLDRAQKNISTVMRQLDGQVEKVVGNASMLVKKVESTQISSYESRQKDISQLVEEIEVLAQKIKSDFEHVQQLQDEPRSLAQATKMALLHMRNYLPSLQECCVELNGLAQEGIERKSSILAQGLQFMRQIALTEANFAQANAQLLKLDVSAECGEVFDYIEIVTQLPLTYGMLLIEAIRRNEWADKIKNESALLAEDIAAFREEEERRRKKWLKTTGGLLAEDTVIGKAFHFDVNIEQDEHPWPIVTRENMSRYFTAIQTLKGMEKVSRELQEAAEDLDQPSKRQIKKAKGFKMGSVHEASSTGRGGSFLLRENDEVKILRDLNASMESELKGHRARVRRLEELVAKNGSTPRGSAGNIFQASETGLSELSNPAYGSVLRATNESLSRKPSISSRRMSSNRSVDDQGLARRILNLETELMEERKRCQEAERQANAATQLRKEMEDARSTNKDLMENMEAQQREFSSERRMLEEDLSRQKIKVEEFEDELDRVLGSRDNEKIGVDRKVRTLESELEETRQSLYSLVEEARRRDEDQQPHTKSQHTSSSATAEEPLPSTISGLVRNLEDLAERSSRHVKDLAQALATAQSENESLQMLIERREKEAAETLDQLRVIEEDASTLRNDAAAERARAGALTTELEDGRSQLRILRAKFADGETGSDSLRQRLEEQAGRAGNLAAKLAEAKSHVNSLDIELSSLQRRHNKLQTSHGGLASRLEQRSARDKELTNRLVVRNEDLARLLDSLGLSVTNRDGAFAIQRTSKLQSASTTLTEPESPAVASTAGPSFPRLAFEASPCPAALQWMHAATPEEENNKFTQLLAKIDELHVGTVSEAIIKLRRDVEWTGKKWKNEARNYRDRYHKAKMEGHEKIAFRSFKEGDLALFLPTKNQATRPWAAFNVGAPHYFLREQDSHRLQNREWLVARISKIQERVVDLSKMIDSLKGGDGRSIGETSDGLSFEDDNPFELSDGLRWYLIEATEEKAGAPTTPGMAKTTVASAIVDVKGSIRMKKLPAGSDASGKLNKNLESRRSSTHSKHGSVSGAGVQDGVTSDTATNYDGISAIDIIKRKPSAAQFRPGSHNSSASGPGPGPTGLGIQVVSQRQPPPSGSEEVRTDQLLGP